MHYRDCPTGLPQTCPGTKSDRPCIAVPLTPTAFAKFCVLNEIQPSDAIAMAPSWIYSITGDKIGTRARPYRLSDYVVALDAAKNPNAVQQRIRSAAILAPMSTRKRKVNNDEQVSMKKPKLEVLEVGSGLVKEGCGTAKHSYEKVVKEEKIVVKTDS